MAISPLPTPKDPKMVQSLKADKSKTTSQNPEVDNLPSAPKKNQPVQKSVMKWTLSQSLSKSTT